jgi:cytochrome c-type biogenesis protein
MDAVLAALTRLVETNAWIAPFASFLGGILTASNPCVLVMIPLAMAYVGGYGESMRWRQNLALALAFVVGLSITFTVLGVIAVAMGGLLGDVGRFWGYAVAGVCLIMGLHLLGVFHFSFPLPNLFKSPKKGVIGALLLGLLFGVVSTPCATPILSSLLVYIASKGSYGYGAVLLFAYALGHCLVIMIAGASMGMAKALLESRHLQKASLVLQKTAGVVIIVIGFYFLWISL